MTYDQNDMVGTYKYEIPEYVMNLHLHTESLQKKGLILLQGLLELFLSFGWNEAECAGRQ